MGYSYDASYIKCPIFKRVIRTTKGQFIGIECEALKVNLGFDVYPVIRVKDKDDLRDYTDIFCKDLYKTCPYYTTWIKKEEA